MNEPLLSSTHDPFLDLEGVGSRCDGEHRNLSTPSQQQSSTFPGSFSISKKYLNLFPTNHLNLAAHRWNDCHFEGKKNVIAVFDTDYESLETFMQRCLFGIRN